MVSATIDTKQILKALQSLPKNIQKNVMTGAVRAGANVVKDEAKARVRVSKDGQKYGKYPHKAGNLKASIGVTKRKSPKGVFIFSVSPRKGTRNDGFYGRFIELGTSKMSAKPFLRPAAEASVNKTLEAAKDYMAQRIPSEVAKAR